MQADLILFKEVQEAAMRRCGDCENFIIQGGYLGSEHGFCNAFIQDDGMGKEANLYDGADKCSKFKELSRVRTDTSEFTYDPLLRAPASFEEK